MLGEPEERWHVAQKAHVHAERCGPSRFLICMPSERLFPKAIGVEPMWMCRGIQQNLRRIQDSN